MTFDDILSDLEKLTDLPLESIKPGAGLTIISIDKEHNNLQLRTSAGTLKSRPLLELAKIWNELQKSPAVHVDKVLNGSGTSRNQPETILANLPYIEWAKIHNKKHLVFVRENTHPYGTLCQMDKTAASKIAAQIDNLKEDTDFSIVVVTDDSKRSIEQVQSVSGGIIEAKEPGVYVLETNSQHIVFISSSITSLRLGTYPVVNVSYPIKHSPPISIIGTQLIPIIDGDVMILVREK